MSDGLFEDKGFYFLPLGGSNEIGMNLNLYRYEGKWLIIDMGIGFADDYLPGVDVVVPDIRFLVEQREHIAGLVLTHAHEDHLGAVPYLWESVRCPVYATPFTAAVLKAKLAEQRAEFRVPVQQVEPGSKFSVGPFKLEMVELTHSIPEMNAVAIRTTHGTVLHTGDWKFDANPMVGAASDHEALIRLGEEGVLAMVCDSTNVFVQGESGSELTVRDNLVEVVAGCAKRVVVTTFASNIARLESIVHAAVENGRQVAVSGRSMHRMVGAAKDAGYLQELDEFLTERQAMDLPREKVLILATGSQGEARAGLWKIARGDHPELRVQPGDTVVFSSREIPGNEKRIAIVQNRFIQRGVEVLTWRDAPIHVSGHPAREELTRMYQMVKPRIAIPVHGEQRHMAAHAALATELQVPQAILGYNGAVIRLDGAKAQLIGEVPSGYIAVDGTSLLDADGPVMRMRRKTRDEGVVFVSLQLDPKTGEVADAEVSAPGLLDEQDDAEWLEDIAEDIAEIVEAKGKKADRKQREDAVRQAVRRLFGREFNKKPVVITHIFDV